MSNSEACRLQLAFAQWHLDAAVTAGADLPHHYRSAQEAYRRAQAALAAAQLRPEECEELQQRIVTLGARLESLREQADWPRTT